MQSSNNIYKDMRELSEMNRDDNHVVMVNTRRLCHTLSVLVGTHAFKFSQQYICIEMWRHTFRFLNTQ